MNQRQMISRYKRNPFVTRRCKTSIAAALLAVIAACAFAQVVWQPPIRHETITFYDASRDNRPVAVEIVVRRDKEIQANAGPPTPWGVLQIATGPISDRWGRKGLIASGMWVQAAGLFNAGSMQV